jgi:2-oxoglutarate dehydrogenase E2 component (dihydrolipoamide succinyltransferase)
MPQLGESVVEGTISRWLKSPGDRVDKYEPMLEVTTDKVDTEITAPAEGQVLQIYVDEGETVEAGRLLAYIGQQDEEVPAPDSPEALRIVAHGAEAESEPAPAPPVAPEEPESEPEPEPPSEVKRKMPGRKRISPVVARIAGEHDVDLSQVSGTGRGGRVTKKDILQYVEVRDATLPREQKAGEFFHPPGVSAPSEEAVPEPAQEPSPAAPEKKPAPTPTAAPGELLPLTGMRQSIAEHMVRSAQTSPHVSTIFETDCSRIVAHRNAHKQELARHGLKLTFTPYFVLAAVAALKAVPIVNSSFTDQGIQLKADINIGVAVALEDGLIVPVIKQTDEKSLKGITRAVNDLAQRAREKRLAPEEVQGGTFTITNHGVSGSLFATPIINQPQAAILGVGLIQKRVVVTEDDAIAVRPMAYTSLTFDHRILDGAVADRFMSVLKETLETWQ